MRFKNFNYNTKKLLSIFGAIAILAASLPFGALLTDVNVMADGSLVNFQSDDASEIVKGNENFSILGADNGDEKYFYAENRGSDVLELTFANLGFQKGKAYSIAFDAYVVRVSNDNEDRLIGLELGEDQAFVKNADLLEEEWASFKQAFTVGENVNSLIFKIFGNGKVIIDNLVIIDENGNETALDHQKACADTSLKTSFVSGTLYDIAKEVEDNENGYLSADIPENSAINHNEYITLQLGLDTPLEEGAYTIKADLRFTKVGKSSTAACLAVESNASGKEPMRYFIGKEIVTLGESETFESVLDLTSDYTFIRLHIYQGCKVTIDNLKLLDDQGQEVRVFDFEDATAFAGSTHFVQKGTEAVTVPAIENKYLKLQTASHSTATYAQFMKIKLSEALPIGAYSMSFDLCRKATSTTDHIMTIRFPYKTSGLCDPNVYLKTDTVALDKTTRVNITFTLTAASEEIQIYVYQGNTLQIDNIKIVNSDKSVNRQLDFEEFDLSASVIDNDGLASIGDASTEPQNFVNESGMEIAVLKGKAGSQKANIKLGGKDSPLTLKNNTSYKLSFKYYQSSPTKTGDLDLFTISAVESVVGKENDAKSFKKNNSTGWPSAYITFNTGTVSDKTADWISLEVGAQATVFFDDFRLVEQEEDKNKEIRVVDFETADDDIYPASADGTFSQTNSFSGTSNGSNGYFLADNKHKLPAGVKENTQNYEFKGIKLKSYTTYEISIDYYVPSAFKGYALAFGFNPTNVGITAPNNGYTNWVSNVNVVGWHTMKYVVTTGEVVPNASYIKLAIYDSEDGNRKFYLDNLTIKEVYKIDAFTNDSNLGTVSKFMTVEGGGDAKVVAHPFDGVTFEGWYEYGDKVCADTTYRLENIYDNHNLEARFSGEVVKPSHIVQGFEDYDLGEILFEYYEIVDNPKYVYEGEKSLHVKPDRININDDFDLFFPLITNAEQQLKSDTSYDVYVWLKPAKPATSYTYFQLVHSGVSDYADMIYSPSGSGVQANITPSAATALEADDGWFKYQIGTITKSMVTNGGLGMQVCKFNNYRSEGASIDDVYIDRIEVVERVPDYANLKFTEDIFDIVENSNFEEKVTEDNWLPLTKGVSIEKIDKPEYVWQGDYNLKFDAAKSGGKEYTRIIPIPKQLKNYTFAAWTKLSAGSNISVGLYADGKYTKFENIKNAKSGTLALKDNGKWNRVAFTFNSGEYENAYLVIKGTKGVLYLDNVEIFVATRGYTEDPNDYRTEKPKFEMVDPIAFPDVVETGVSYVETVVENEPEDVNEVVSVLPTSNENIFNDVVSDDTAIEEAVSEEATTEIQSTEEEPKKKKYRVVRRRKGGGNSVWLWVGIGGSAALLAAAAVVFVLLVRKRRAKEEAENNG